LLVTYEVNNSYSIFFCLGERSDSETSDREEIELKTISKRLPPGKPTKKPQNNYKCPYMILAKEYVSSLQWHDTFFDSSFDKCYCTNCYPTKCADVTVAGGAEYVIPRGWVRLGLSVDRALAENYQIWTKWIVTFHGTSTIAAHSILAHRQFCLPGDTLIDGTQLGIRPGHIPNKNHIYTSPTIAYSSLKVYSPINHFRSFQFKRPYKVQIVFQCRQKPRSFTTQGETVGAGVARICQHIPNSQVEYYTDIRVSIIAYGLLVRLE
jgi:hypothetical protein